MECPSCGLAVSSPSGSDTEGTTRTHDTSATSYHIALPTWLSQLDQAIQSAWAKRFARYSKVAVLMISWEETYHGAMKVELCRLASVDALATAPVGQPLTIVELHRQIIVRLQSFHEQAIFDQHNEIRICNSTGKALYTKAVRVTPSHLFLAGNENPRLLALMPSGSVETNVSKSSPDGNQTGWPKVLLAIRLLDDDSIERDVKN
ncbi:hypothetical protein F5B21DRAFT_529217 [Xylaria acuta]|nr:hypothetical protein F5B21DRAFT_529217 [Xylaria acuta]